MKATRLRNLAAETSLLRPNSRRLVTFALLLSVATVAQAQAPQFLPELDTYLKVHSLVRLYVQAEGDRDEGVPIQSTFGPSIQLYVKPLLRLKKVTAFDLDDAKQRPLVLEVGYRIITAPNEPADNRFEPVATTNFPMKYSFLITDRNRADLDWKGGTFRWRYRNKLTVERTFAIHSYHIIPSLSAEPYYTSQYGKWSTTDLYANCIFPLGKYFQLDPYYEHENNTGKKPNVSDNYIGLEVHIFFAIAGKHKAPSP